MVHSISQLYWSNGLIQIHITVYPIKCACVFCFVVVIPFQYCGIKFSIYKCRWLSVRLQSLQCVSNGVTAVLHKAIKIFQGCFTGSLTAPLSVKQPWRIWENNQYQTTTKHKLCAYFLLCIVISYDYIYKHINICHVTPIKLQVKTRKYFYSEQFIGFILKKKS